MSNLGQDPPFFISDSESHGPRFKTLQRDPELLALEQKLREWNLWADREVQIRYRWAKLGTDRTRAWARAQLRQIIEHYEVEALRCGDGFMPYATADQISHNHTGVHILDQAGNNIPLFASEYSYCLLWLVLGPQGGGKSSAVFHQLNQLDVPLLILDPKGTWQYRAEQLRARVIPPQSIRLDFQFDEELSPLYLHSVVEGIAFCTGLQYGLSCLYEALDIALAQLQRYTEQTGEHTSLCLKDLQEALYLCDTRNSKRAQYVEAARTALDTLLGRGPLFTTRSGLPLDELFAGRYVLPCWHLTTSQSRFLAWFLINNLYFRSLNQPECTSLRSLLVIDDASKFISRPDTVFGSGSRTSVYLHLLSVLRSTGRGIIFIDQLIEPIYDDVKHLCNNWLVVGGMRGSKNQREVAGAMHLSPEQTAMLNKLQPREAVCFCPTTYSGAVHGFIPEVPPPGRTRS